MNTVGLASDHAGYALKQHVKDYLEAKGIKFHDYGTYSEASCDYPDFAHALARGLEAGECEMGIAICGSGQGISMTLNKHQSIRAALCCLPGSRMRRARSPAQRCQRARYARPIHHQRGGRCHYGRVSCNALRGRSAHSSRGKDSCSISGYKSFPRDVTGKTSCLFTLLESVTPVREG